jgi:hypothetical protein
MKPAQPASLSRLAMPQPLDNVSLSARNSISASRANPPAATCPMPDGSTMTFPSFGAMVQHMRAMEAA